jgi:SulP family sulfate permease
MEGFIRRFMFLLFLAIPIAAYCLTHWIPRQEMDVQETTSFGSFWGGNSDVAFTLTSPFGRRAIEETDGSDNESSNDEEKRGTLWSNFLAGAVIALGCLPEAIAFSFITGVSPLNGIWAGVVLGIYTSMLGGRPGMISCSSAATAVVLVDVTSNSEYGHALLPVSVGVCGVLQVIAGALNLSRFISLVPHPVMLGFVNGLAIVIARAQLAQFQENNGAWVDSNTMWGMITTTAVSMGSAWVFPRIPRVGHLLPGPLVAIITAITWSALTSTVFNHRSLVDIAGEKTFSGGYDVLPVWNFPPAGLPFDRADLWAQAVATGVRMALVGIVESLLTLKLLDQITETRGSGRQESIALGCGNVVSALFGLQGGCALIGQSLINVGSGGKGRFSGFIMASVLGVSVLMIGPVVGMIPVAALVGIMFLVSLNTFAWGSLSLLRHIAWTERLVIFCVTLVTIVEDLATAVLFGLFLSAVTFAWTSARDVQVESSVDSVKDTHEFHVKGPLFFGSAMAFQRKIEPSRIKEEKVIVHVGQVLDHSALEAITQTDKKLRQAGKEVQWNGLTEGTKRYMESVLRGSEATSKENQ